MIALVSMPDPTTFLTAVGTWSTPVFTDLLPVIEYSVGILLAFAVVAFLIHVVGSVVRNLIH